MCSALLCLLRIPAKRETVFRLPLARQNCSSFASQMDAPAIPWSE
jgi:hypothetical protein